MKNLTEPQLRRRSRAMQRHLATRPARTPSGADQIIILLALMKLVFLAVVLIIIIGGFLWIMLTPPV